MKKLATYFSVFFIYSSILLALSGCASTEPSRFYTLNSLADEKISPQASEKISQVSIGIGPIEVPDYLDRPQIVIRSGLNEIKVSEHDRWAGSLSENITMVIRENLSFLIGTERVFAYPWDSSSDIDYKVSIKIIRLEGIPGDHVTLKALWTVSSRKENKEIITHVSDIKEKLNASGYDEMVAVMSRNFATLSREIAREIKAIFEPKLKTYTKPF